MKTSLSKRQLHALISLSDRLCSLRNQFDDDLGTDVPLKDSSNGTVGSCLDCAVAALDTILQEYIN